MASWAAPHDWRAGELAATSLASGTVNMNQQLYGNMDWLGTTHDHSGGTRGNNKVGPVIYFDLMDQGLPATPGSTASRMFASGTNVSLSIGGTSTFAIVNSTHSHPGL